MSLYWLVQSEALLRKMTKLETFKTKRHKLAKTWSMDTVKKSSTIPSSVGVPKTSVGQHEHQQTVEGDLYKWEYLYISPATMDLHPKPPFVVAIDLNVSARFSHRTTCFLDSVSGLNVIQNSFKKRVWKKYRITAVAILDSCIGWDHYSCWNRPLVNC